jgi:hypothetical protein
MQRFGTTRVEVRYSRPSARGRELFGALVPWGRVWTPGADTATSVTVSDSVRVNGQPLAPGTYSLWTIPGDTSWTIIFNRRQPVWHTQYPEGGDALRIESAPRRGPHVEMLTFSFPDVDGLRGEVILQWGTTIVPIAIEAYR